MSWRSLSVISLAVWLVAIPVGTARADWSAPASVPIASPATPVPLSLRIAVAPSGGMVAVWCEDDGSGSFVLESLRIAPNGAAGTARPLSTSSTAPTGTEVLAGPDGTATVIWKADDGLGNGVVRTIRIAPDGTPGAVAHGLSLAGANALEPDLALDEDGAATVVWQQTSGGGDPAIHYIRIAADGTIGSALDISDDGEGEGAFTPRVAVGPDGVATVAWVSADGPQSVGLQAVAIAASGAVGPIRDPVTDVDGTIYRPALAVGSDGDATAVWQQQPDGGDSVAIETVRIAASGASDAVHDVGEPHSVAAASLLGYRPTVVVGPDNVATAVWTQSQLDTPYVVRTARIATTGVPGPAHDLSPPSNLRSAVAADATVGPDGVVTAIWLRTHPGGDDSAIEAIRIAANGTVGSVTTLAFSESPEGIPDLDSPAIDASSDGTVGAVWQSAAAIHSSRFTTPGDPAPPPSPPRPLSAAPVTPPHPSLTLRVRPRSARTRRGGRVRLTATIGNAGDAVTTRARLCVRVPRRAFRAVRCAAVGRLSPGQRARRSIAVRVRRAPKAARRTYVLVLTASATGAASKAARARIRVR